MTQVDKPKPERTGAHHSIIEWSFIISVSCLGGLGFIQGLLEKSVLLLSICGIILAGTSIILMRERFHVFLERYEFSFIWLIVLSIVGYGIYHVIIGVLS